MRRIVAIGGVLLAMVAIYLLVGRAQSPTKAHEGASEASEEAVATGPADVGGEAGRATGQSGKGRAPMPMPLRMSAKDAGGQSGNPEEESLEDAFQREKTDSEIASERSSMVRTVVDSLVGDGPEEAVLEKVECRKQHCLIKIGGKNQAKVVALLDALQDERGFYGKAESLMLSRDGESIGLYLRFAKSPAIAP